MRRPQKTCAICESGVRVVDQVGLRELRPDLVEGVERGEGVLDGDRLQLLRVVAQPLDAEPGAGADEVHRGLVDGEVRGEKVLAAGRADEALTLQALALLTELSETRVASDLIGE